MKPQRRIPVLIPLVLAFSLAMPGVGAAAASKSSSGSAGKKSASGKPAAKGSTAAKGNTAAKGKAPAKGSTAGKGSTSAKGKAPAKGKTTRASASKKKGKGRTAPSNSQRVPDSARIEEIQQALSQRGYNCQTSGVWDSSTVEALKKFQEAQNINNLTGRGKLDSLTLIALGLGPQSDNQPPARTVPASPSQPEGKNE